MKGHVDIREIAIQALAYKCRKSFFFFVKQFWETIINETPVYNWHIPYLCEELEKLSESIVKRTEKPYDIVINIPPGTTKSTITTIMYPAWLWAVDPSIRIITNSYSAAIAIEHATKSRDIIISDKYSRLFPEVVIRGDKSAKTLYENTAGGARYTTSTGGAPTGLHAHLIISDDPQSPAQANSEPHRLAAVEHTKTLASRKVDKANTPTITIMQRLHELDVTGFLLGNNRKGIHHICLPAELSNIICPAELKERYIDGLLDPVRLNRDVLNDQALSLGSRAYSGQFEQNPVVDGGNIVKSEWFGKISPVDFSKIYKNEAIVFFVDTAFTEKTANDPTGIIAACKIGNDLYITHAKKVYKEFPELVKFLPEYVYVHGYTYRSVIRIEPKANGLSVIQQLKKSTSLNVTNTPTPRESKDVRLHAISPVVEAGRVILVAGTWNESFIDEVAGFPAKTHDEYVDLLVYAADFFLKAKPINLRRLENQIY